MIASDTKCIELIRHPFAFKTARFDRSRIPPE
jgi:hypothetical protein